MSIEKYFDDIFGNNHYIFTSSGSAAIITALVSLDIAPGSEIIIPSICCPAVLTAVQMAGLKCVFCDVSLETFSIDVESIDAVRTARTAAIIAVHSFGADCGLDRIMAYALHHNIKLIEDACLAYGNRSNGRSVGAIGDVGIISFGYDKPADIGYGGAIITRSDHFAKQARKFLDENKFFAFEIAKYDDLKLEFRQFRTKFYDRYENSRYIADRLVGKFDYPVIQDVAYWRFPISVGRERDELISFAKTKGIIFTKHYRSLEILSSTNSLINSKFVDETIINLFVKIGTPKHYLKNSTELIINQIYRKNF